METPMFDVEQVLNWNEVEKLRGQHDKLKMFFPDQDKPYWAMVGNGNWVITRNVDSMSNTVTFNVYDRTTFIISTYNYLKQQGKVDEYYKNKK